MRAAAVRTALVAAVLLVSAVAGVASPTPVNVSRSATESTGAVVAADGPLVVAAWIESENLTDGVRGTIYAARSTDSGQTFAPPVQVEALTGFAAALDVRIDSGTVHMAWLTNSFTIGEPTGVDYVRSLDGGASFESVQLLNVDAPPGAPAMAVGGASVGVVWTARGVAYASRSLDGGGAFEAPASLSDSAVDGTARVARADGGFVAGWIERADATAYSVRCDRIPDFEPGPSAEPVTVAESWSPLAELVLGASASRVFAFWTGTDRGRRALAGSRSADGGGSFQAFGTVGEAGALAMPRVAVVEDVAHVVYLDDGGKLVYSAILADGVPPLAGRRLGRLASFPDVSAGGGRLSIVWSTGSGRKARIDSVSGSALEGPGPRRKVTRRGEFGAGARTAATSGAVVALWTEPIGAARDVFVARLDTP